MEWFPYSLRLKKPLKLPNAAALTSREGILIHDPDTGGWGDAAPLPGYSTETLEEVIEAVKQEDFTAVHLPSLRFALSCVKQPWGPPSERVIGNALWIPASESVASLQQRLKGWRNALIKVKPGKDPDITALKHVLDMRPDIRFRIDGNRQWTVRQTLQLFRSLPESAIDYIEEPLSDSEDYQTLWAEHPVPIALDESLLLPEGPALADHENVAAFILKPTLIGGMSDIEPWLEKARISGKTVVWSSCFESGVGVWHLARWAAGGAPAGLDTGSRFETDLVTPRPLMEKGKLPLPTQLEVSDAFSAL